MKSLKTKEIFILLPGWTRSLRTYKKFIKEAPENVSVEFIDYQKIIPEGDISLFPERLFKYLQTKDLKRISIIGFSLGGALAIEFALKYPQIIKILYLVNSAGIYGKESVLEIIKNQTLNLLERKGAKTFRSVYNSNALTTNPLLNMKLGFYANKVDHRSKGILRRFPKTYILWGDKDVVHPFWQGEEFNKLILKSKLIKIEGGGHDWMVYSPWKFWNKVD